MSASNRPAAATSTNPKALVQNVPVIYTYLNIPKHMKRLIPQWLWAKKVENVKKSDRSPAGEPSEPLFKSESADMLTLIDDFSRRGIRPFHIHLMVRENGNVRIRVSWLSNPQEVLEEREIDWIVMVFRRFAWSVMAHPNSGTEHLPPHIAIGCARPKERDQTTTVESVQIFQDELSLIVDSDEGISAQEVIEKGSFFLKKF